MKILHVNEMWRDGLNIQELMAFADGTAEGTGRALKVGIASFPKGVRHPETGLKPHAEREISLVVAGSFDLHMADGDYRAQAGDLIVIEPGEEHATTSREDGRVFYILHG